MFVLTLLLQAGLGQSPLQAGILTTTQQFGAASGIAVIGAVFYSALGAAPGRATFVSAMVVAMSVNAALVAVTWLLRRRTLPREPVARAGELTAAEPAEAR